MKNSLLVPELQYLHSSHLWTHLVGDSRYSLGDRRHLVGGCRLFPCDYRHLVGACRPSLGYDFVHHRDCFVYDHDPDFGSGHVGDLDLCPDVGHDPCHDRADHGHDLCDHDHGDHRHGLGDHRHGLGDHRHGLADRCHDLGDRCHDHDLFDHGLADRRHDLGVGHDPCRNVYLYPLSSFPYRLHCDL